MNPIADGLWSVPHQTRMAGVRFDGRMTVARLPGGGLWLYSPVPVDDALAAELDDLGPVRHIVAPSTFHHLYAAAAAARWPDATAWGTPALANKRPSIAFDALVDGDASAPFGDALAVRLVTAGPKLEEIVALHRPSETLIVCDLVFNVRAHPHWWTRLALKLAGAYGGLCQSRLWRRSAKDRAGLARDVGAVVGWSFRRIVPAHGEVLEADDAPELLAEACRWARGAEGRT